MRNRGRVKRDARDQHQLIAFRQQKLLQNWVILVIVHHTHVCGEFCCAKIIFTGTTVFLNQRLQPCCPATFPSRAHVMAPASRAWQILMCKNRGEFRYPKNVCSISICEKDQLTLGWGRNRVVRDRGRVEGEIRDQLR